MTCVFTKTKLNAADRYDINPLSTNPTKWSNTLKVNLLKNTRHVTLLSHTLMILWLDRWIIAPGVPNSIPLGRSTVDLD